MNSDLPLLPPGLTADGAIAMCEALAEAPAMIELHLDDNGLPDDAEMWRSIGAWVRAPAAHEYGRRISIAGNHISVDSLEGLLEASGRTDTIFTGVA